MNELRGMDRGMDVSVRGMEEVTTELERGVNRLRNTNPDKFQSMCKMHLSFLLDLSGASLEEFLSEPDDDSSDQNQSSTSKSSSKTSKSFTTPFQKRKNKNCSVFSDVPSLSEDCIKQVLQLVQYLGRPNNIKQEGLFRKTGHLQRQKQLKHRLFTGESLQLDNNENSYTAHDCANVLKQFLGDLPEPLLGDRYYKGHCQVPDMLPTDTDALTEKDRKRIFNKQIKSIQLLFHLLPVEQATILECLLKLLHKVSKVEDNKMTADTLGTLFAPHILCPRKITALELRAVSKSITKSVAFMIENGPQLFKIPLDLARDIATYWREMEQAPDSRPNSRASMTSSSEEDDPDLTNERFGLRHDSSMATNTCIAFVDREATKAASATTDTETALAQLYAHVQSMPDSSRKRKLLKQFNNMNGGVATPLDTANNNNKSIAKHKRTKSIGNSLKKHFMKGRKNRTNVNLNLSEDDLLSTTQFDSSVYDKENEFSLCLTPCQHVRTPVKKLFADAYKTPGGIDQVCIVDMNDTLSPIVTTPDDNKRKRRSYSLGNDSIVGLSAILSPVAEKALKASSLSKAIINPRCRAPLSIFTSPRQLLSTQSPSKKLKTSSGCYV
ncbi:rho GTPase-activating protein 19-like [Tubulanus polymorphus]|uniref:rho GTPase-activating protein 19-like n=1 Tax=Tubulanus polymorphus TaxID=672921 RepID=UPI003DA400B5